MEGLCGAKCNECESFKKKRCKGCNKDRKCWIANYIEIGGKENYEELKRQLIDEFNSLKIDGMPKIDKLYELNGSVVNLEFSLPNNNKVKFLYDDEVYLGNQVENEFNDKSNFGILGNMSFLLVCEYDENGNNPEIIIYKRR